MRRELDFSEQQNQKMLDTTTTFNTKMNSRTPPKSPTIKVLEGQGISFEF